ncbi:MAG: NADP-dependent phosphogluconate dehydrogenase [Deltaproteobacteria bacterium]|nr:NADP-dependent phosphogluconate dehydrogenase [Deltaproteobacteria bacterium]
MGKPKVGVVGLAVMGSNLARNIESRGIPVAVFNRSYDVTEKFLEQNKGKNFVTGKTVEEFVSAMESPRQILIMVKAGGPTDAVIDSLLPLLQKGDILIDGGNAYYPDTIRREKKCKEAGIGFIGLGVSGGEEGALNGPSLMPGGPKESWQIVAPLLEKIAARVDGQACTAYIGPDGSGHFVKMVHNGIEYGDMQLIAEAYHLLRDVTGCKPPELADIFERWNQGALSSFLIEITSKVFRRKDDDGSSYLVDKVLDKAGQKGTGKWTAQVALDLGVAIPTLSMAVDARILSSIKEERVKASKELPGPKLQDFTGDRTQFVDQVHDALYCSKIMAYAQGMALLAAASREWNWDLKLNEIAALWKGGCIIRAKFLDQIRRAYQENPALANLMLDKVMRDELSKRIDNLRAVVKIASERGIPAIAFNASLAYYDSYRSEQLPQNLTQGQRDFFGAHTYERVDRAGVFHTEWEQ